MTLSTIDAFQTAVQRYQKKIYPIIEPAVLHWHKTDLAEFLTSDMWSSGVHTPDEQSVAQSILGSLRKIAEQDALNPKATRSPYLKTPAGQTPSFQDIEELLVAHYRVDIGLSYLDTHIQKELGERLDLDPDFQRDYVWTVEQQITYVEWLLIGGVSGREIYFNHPGWMRDFKGDYVLVDGKQRLNAVLAFLHDEIPAFGYMASEWDIQRIDQTLGFNVADLQKRDDVLLWYIQLNEGGTAHTPADLDKVKELILALDPASANHAETGDYIKFSSFIPPQAGEKPSYRKNIRRLPRSFYKVDMPIDMLLDRIERDKREFGLNFDPDYQRDYVWTAQQKVSYVEWVLRGGQSGLDIFFNHPGWMRDWKGAYEVVDGKQRLEAVMGFFKGEVPAFGYYIHEWSDQPDMLKMLHFHVNDLTERVDLLRWYLSMNAGGTIHTPEEMQKVKAMIA